jgi:hypothetical protein
VVEAGCAPPQHGSKVRPALYLLRRDVGKFGHIRMHRLNSSILRSRVRAVKLPHGSGVAGARPVGRRSTWQEIMNGRKDACWRVRWK